jgi:hypothetical protein
MRMPILSVEESLDQAVIQGMFGKPKLASKEFQKQLCEKAAFLENKGVELISEETRLKK